MTQNEVLKLIAKALGGDVPKQKAKAKAKKAKGKSRSKLTDAEREAFRTTNDAICVEEFTKAGYSDVQPRINVLTFNGWIAKGRKVKPGEKAVRVGPFALFHEVQTGELTIAASTETANTQAA